MSLAVVVSPYHLTTREVPAMAALLLADRAITLLPAPPGGRVVAEALAETAPRYARLVETWRWSVPLWNAGVLVAPPDDDGPAPDIRATHAEIFASEAWASLRTLLEDRQHESEYAYLQALAHDLLRGGPDPALSIPVAAGLDRFAARRGLPVVRSAPSSLAQKLEMRSARPGGGVAVPILLGARAERILDAREALADELAGLRRALHAACAAAACEADTGDELARAAARYRTAFESGRASFAEDDPDEARVVTGEASVRIVTMSSDAALESSERATRALGLRRPPSGNPGITLAPGRTVSLVVRAIGPH